VGESALKFYEDPHVIVDVGGQDIKIIILHNGRVKDFKLNTQCSAGNGYFLQSTAEGFGLSVNQYADLAFSAQAMPVFGYGCAVFMQSDIVNFQRQGWRAEEILAGLAAVLPKNVFLYVASIPNLAALGSRFVLQGGTQNNLAARQKPWQHYGQLCERALLSVLPQPQRFLTEICTLFPTEPQRSRRSAE
jgi:activator of 2-hydroxyglutaryl-CoA dehydratase